MRNLSRFGIVLVASVLLGMPAMAQPGGGGEMPPPPVEVTTAKRAPLFTSINAIGSLNANESVVIRPEISGLIKEYQFEEGTPVKAGQPLFTLDQDILSAEARRASSSAKLGTADLDRARKLKEAGYSTQSALDSARTAAVTSRADASAAQARLNKTVIRAPFDGVIGLRQVAMGDYVNAGQDLVNLEQIDPIKLDFTVPEVFMAQLRNGMEVSVEVDVYPGEKFVGQIYAINPKVDPATRTIAARARIDNPDAKLRPGLFARVSVPLASANAPTSIVVPETALIPSGSKMFAYRVKADGNAEQLEVKMGQRNNGMVEVAQGLSDGDTVIVTGQMRVVPGKPVNIVNRMHMQPATEVAPAAAVQPAAESVSAPALQGALEKSMDENVMVSDTPPDTALAPATVTVEDPSTDAAE